MLGRAPREASAQAPYAAGTQIRWRQARHGARGEQNSTEPSKPACERQEAPAASSAGSTSLVSTGTGASSPPSMCGSRGDAIAAGCLRTDRPAETAQASAQRSPGLVGRGIVEKLWAVLMGAGCSPSRTGRRVRYRRGLTLELAGLLQAPVRRDHAHRGGQVVDALQGGLQGQQTPRKVSNKPACLHRGPCGASPSVPCAYRLMNFAQQQLLQARGRACHLAQPSDSLGTCVGDSGALNESHLSASGSKNQPREGLDKYCR